MRQLQDPPEYLRVREVRNWYIDYQVEMIGDETADHEDLTAPLLVVASVTKEDFKVQNVNKYTCQVCPQLKNRDYFLQHCHKIDCFIWFRLLEVYNSLLLFAR